MIYDLGAGLVSWLKTPGIMEHLEQVWKVQKLVWRYEQPVSSCNTTRLLLHQNIHLSNNLNCYWTTDSGGAFFSKSGFREGFDWLSHFKVGCTRSEFILSWRLELFLRRHWKAESKKVTASKPGGKSTTCIARTLSNRFGVCIVLV